MTPERDAASFESPMDGGGVSRLTIALSDETDLETVYRELAPAVLGYLKSHGVDAAEDVAGEVFVQVVRDIAGFSGDGAALRRWVFTIAHNRMVDHFRRRTRRPEQLLATPPDRATESDSVERAVIDPQLLAALRVLSPSQREVVALRFIADLSIADVARIVRRSPGAVKALQTRALARLATLLPREL